MIDVIDNPTVRLPATFEPVAGSTTTLSGIVISDAWAERQSRPMQLNLTTQLGSIATAAHPTPARFIFVEGTLAQLNAAVASIKYTAPAKAGTVDHIGIDPWNQAGHSIQDYIVARTK